MVAPAKKSALESYYQDHILGLPKQWKELLPSAAIGGSMGFLSAAVFRASAILEGTMPPLLVLPKPTRFFLASMPTITIVASLLARGITDGYDTYQSQNNSQIFKNTLTGMAFTLVSGFLTFIETFSFGAILTGAGMPMSGRAMIAFFLSGALFSSSIDSCLRSL